MRAVSVPGVLVVGTASPACRTLPLPRGCRARTPAFCGRPPSVGHRTVSWAHPHVPGVMSSQRHKGGRRRRQRPPVVILQGALATLGIIIGLVREPWTQTSQPITASKREERKEREGGEKRDKKIEER